MIDLQNPYAYEAFLNNILHKVPFYVEVGVERVVITFLNDILSHLCKWPWLSAEDISKFEREVVNNKYYGFKKMLTLSTPDVLILSGSYQAQGDSERIRPYVVIEVKKLATNPDEVVFTGNGAQKVIQKLKNELDIIEDILETGFDLCEGGSAYLIKNKWEVELLPKKDKTDEAFPIKIIDSSRTTVATLHQLDTYILDCYLDKNIRGVIWTNGLCWKIWTKDASGNIIKGLPIRLDQAHCGCVKHNNVQIDSIRFRYLIDKLISFLSTL